MILGERVASVRFQVFIKGQRLIAVSERNGDIDAREAAFGGVKGAAFVVLRETGGKVDREVSMNASSLPSAFYRPPPRSNTRQSATGCSVGSN